MMEPTARDAYLEAQIMTATPQKLRLMLIEAALRFARQAYEAQLGEQHEEVFDATIRCRRLVTELLTSIDRERSPLAKKIVALYVYLFQALTEAQLKRDADKFNDVINVLEIERDTWRELCERMPLAPVHQHTDGPHEIRSSAPAILPASGIQTPTSSFSLDA